jgi:Fic family protein
MKEPNALQVTNFLEESNHIEEEWSQEALDDSIRAWNYLSRFTKLTFNNILETHEILMRTRDCDDSWKGRFRTGPVWIGGREGINHWKIKPALEELIGTINETIVEGNTKKINEIDLADMIRDQHIAYEYIHPFFDGNGRTGRIFYNWTRKQVGLPIDIIKYEERSKYYAWFR